MGGRGGACCVDVVLTALFKPRGEGLDEMTDRASLASATSTRIDSGCKHIQQCRVSQDHMQKLAKGSGEDLFTNKFGYAVHKDEMVLAVRDHWYMKDKQYSENAYPRVISNLGRIADKTGTGATDPPEAMKFMLWMYHNVEHVKQREDFIGLANSRDAAGFKFAVAGGGVAAGTGDWFTMDPAGRDYAFKADLSLLYDFSFVGFANTLGYAHAHHGDTMTSVHIGGLRTVMNGDYPIRCGDKLQWYWPDEANHFFNDKGGRIPKAAPLDLLAKPVGGGLGNARSAGVTDREEFYALQFGQTKDKQKYVPRIKAYVEDHEHPRLYDYMRVFAVAISSARPHEMFDIMIARQAL